MFELKFGFTLKPEAVKEAVKKTQLPRVMKCAYLVEAEMKRMLSIGGKHRVEGSGGRDEKGKFVAHEYTTVPSAPGDAPHLQTGNLRSSIRTAKTEDETAVVGPTLTAWYGKIHEYGGKHHPKRPFARPSLSNMAGRFPELFARLW